MLVSIFDNQDTEGGKFSKESLGGKGYGLWWMQQQGIHVPPALIIPTSMCVEYMKNPVTVMKMIKGQIPTIRQFFLTHMGFMPLLSVRSGARVSMPGMMDTILNVGLDDTNYTQWQERLGTKCVIDSRRRLIQMYGQVVKAFPHDKMEGDDFMSVSLAYKRLTRSEKHPEGEDFPYADVQILSAIEAVFKSWNNERAQTYRKLNDIPDDWGTAVVIQAMVFGNFNENSATGVLFTRNPDSGENEVNGDFLINAQGEDVVAGTHTPSKLSAMPYWNGVVANELLNVADKLEELAKDMQDVEFTVQDGKLYILQTRSGARSAQAAVRIALDMLSEGMIDELTACSRVTAKQIDLADMPVIEPKFITAPKFMGLPACSGIVTGSPVFSSAEAVQASKEGQKVILITKETTPEDIAGMNAAVGVITMEGGATAHAAVVARAMNKPCITGVGQSPELFQQEIISMCGATGRIWFCVVPVIEGAQKYIEKIKALKIGSGHLLVDRAPKHKAKKIVIDLVDLLHMSNQSIMEIINETTLKCDELTLMASAPNNEQKDYLGSFFNLFDLASRLTQIRQWVDSLPKSKSVKVMGWLSKTHPAIDCVTANDLESLVMVKKNGLLIGATPNNKSFVKVIEWLKKDGIHLEQMGTPGQYAAWSVHSNRGVE